MALQNLFRLQFLKAHTDVILHCSVGLGKTHIASALGYTAYLAGKSVLFATAVDAIKTLAAAQVASKLKVELKKYLSPQILILDELGYLPIDKHGADLLFQVISQRYERGSTIITSNRVPSNSGRKYSSTTAPLRRRFSTDCSITLKHSSLKEKATA